MSFSTVMMFARIAAPNRYAAEQSAAIASHAQLPATWAKIGPQTRKPEPMIDASGVTVARHKGARRSFGRSVTSATATATGTIKRLGDIIRVPYNRSVPRAPIGGGAHPSTQLRASNM